MKENQKTETETETAVQLEVENPLHVTDSYYAWKSKQSAVKDLIREEDSDDAKAVLKLALVDQLPSSEDVFSHPELAFKFFKDSQDSTRSNGFSHLEIQGLVPAKFNKEGVCTNILTCDFSPTGKFGTFVQNWGETTKNWINSKKGQTAMKNATKRTVENPHFRQTAARVKISDKSCTCTFSGNFELSPSVKAVADAGLRSLGLT